MHAFDDAQQNKDKSVHHYVVEVDISVFADVCGV